MYLQKNDGFIIKVDVDQITPRPNAIIYTSTSRCHNHHLTIQNIAFSDRHPNIASSPNAGCPTNSIVSDISHFLTPLTLHHSPLPSPREILAMSPKPYTVCYLQEAQRKSTGPPLPSDQQDPNFERVVQYIDQLIADPTTIFRCPHLGIEAHNTMNKDCTQALQDLWSLVEKQCACCTSPEFFKKYNITPWVDNVRTNKSQEDELAEFAVLVEVGEVPSVAWTYLPWAPEEVRNAWPDYCQPWFWQRHCCVGLESRQIYGGAEGNNNACS